MNVSLILGLLLIVGLSDLIKRSQPDVLIVPLLIYGVVDHLLKGGLFGFIVALLGVMIPFLLFCFPYLKGWIRGGDIKLLCALGGYLGPRMILVVLVFSVGASLLFFLLSRIPGSSAVPYLFQVDRETEEEENWRIPHSLAIFIGYCLSLYTWSSVS